MKKTKRILAFALALLLAALMLFACTALAEIDPAIPTDQTTEIVFWHSFTGED